MTESYPPSGRVFVSSTCYDLLDVREALEVTLRGAGLLPVMSDRPSSDFRNPGDANSIETCLVNLRASERCIVVLSQRYGSSLKSAGFDDISATHLEYKVAVSQGIPIAFYVRDRLWGEYGAWRKNPTFSASWAQGEDIERLFDFIEEHERLQNTSKSNWVWPFTSSVDLCDRVLRDLGSTASTAMIRMLSEGGRLPQFSVAPAGWSRNDRTAVVTNSGLVHGARVTVRDPTGTVVTGPLEAEPGCVFPIKFVFAVAAFGTCGGRSPVLTVDYETPAGHRLSDLFAILPDDKGGIRIVPAGRVFRGWSLRATSPEVEHVGGMRTVSFDPINAAHRSNML